MFLNREMAMGCKWILMILGYIFVIISPAEARHLSKRALPFPNGPVTKRPVKTTTYKEERTERSPSQCPTGSLPQIYGNDTVCCHPVVCSSGFEIKTCSTNGGTDECVKCKTGYIQLNNISSFNMNETKCFQELPSHQWCPRSDTKKSRYMPKSCSMFCECKTEACYVGSPCGCTEIDHPCGINQQLNKYTEKCEECPPYSYKHRVGCEGCNYNLTAFSLGMTLPFEEQPDVTTQKGTDSTSELTSTKVTPQIEKEDQPTWMIIALVVCVLVVVIFILLIVIAGHYRQFRIMRMLKRKLCPNQQRPSAMEPGVEGSSEGEIVTLNVGESSSTPLLSDPTGTVDQAPVMEELKSLTSRSHDDSGFGSSSKNTSYPETDVGTCSTGDGAEIVSGELDTSGIQPGDEFDQTQTLSKVVVDMETEQDSQPMVPAVAKVIEKIMIDKSVNNQYSLQQGEKPKKERPIAIINPVTYKSNEQRPMPEPDEAVSSGNSSITSYPELFLSSTRIIFDRLDSQGTNPSVDLDGQPEPYFDNYSEIRESAEGQSLSNPDNGQTSPKQYFMTENTYRKSVVEENDLKVDDRIEGKQEEQTNLPASLPNDDISYEATLCDEQVESVEIELESGGSTGQALENSDTHGLTHPLAPVLIPTSERERGDGADSIETETDASVEIEMSTNI